MGDAVYFAYVEPYSYERCARMLDKFDSRFLMKGEMYHHSTKRCSSSSTTSSSGKRGTSSKRNSSTNSCKNDSLRIPLIGGDSSCTESITGGIESSHGVGSRENKSINSSNSTTASSSSLLNPSIYYHRETAIYTLDKLPVELITISSMKGISRIREKPHDGLFEHVDGGQKRPQMFSGKRVIFFGCRVHPGEASARFVGPSVI